MRASPAKALRLATMVVAFGPPLWSAIVWPADGAWQPLYTSGNEYFWDDLGDESPATVDNVGDTTNYPAAFWLFTDGGTPSDSSDDQLLFRTRMEEQPDAGTNFVWTMFINTDSDLDTVEYALQVDQKDHDQVELAATTTAGSTFGDVALSTSYGWTGSLTDYRRFVTAADGSTFNGDADGFVDWGIPWDSFASVTGATVTTPLAFSPLTSTTHSLINKDIPLGLDEDAGLSNGFSRPRPAIPEPSTLVLTTLMFGALGGARACHGRRRRLARTAAPRAA